MNKKVAPLARHRRSATDAYATRATRFVTGLGGFVEELRLERMLHLKIVRSPYARARIIKVNGGVTGSDFKANLTAVGEGAWGGGPPTAPYPALASDYVSYVGQPVAAVYDEDPYVAEDLAEGVEVDYDPLRPLVDPEDAFAFEPIHPGTKSNVVNRVRLGQGFPEEAPVVLEDELVNERVSPNSMEPRGLLAQYDGSKLTVWSSTQSVHSWKSGICSSVQLARDAVRVVQMDTGGAFGCKSGFYPEYAVACYVSMKTRCPVKWIESRLEHLQATGQGRGARGRVKLFADRSGKVQGVKADLLIDGGAFALGVAQFAPRSIATQLTGPYSMERAFVTATSVYTNKTPYGPYRGQGRPEAAFFYERMMDMLADELKLDPVDVRMRNAGSSPLVSPLGLKIEAFQLRRRSSPSGLAGRPTTGAARRRTRRRSESGSGSSPLRGLASATRGSTCCFVGRAGR